MLNKPYSTLNSILQPWISQKLFFAFLMIILFLTLVHWGLHGIWEPIFYPSVDFKLYHDWITGQNPPPNPNEFQPPFLSLPYSPLWVFILKPLSYFPFSIAKQIWFGINLIILIWFCHYSIRLLRKNTAFPQKPVLTILIPIIILGNYFPLMTNLRVGQANILTFIFILLSFLCYQNNKKDLTGLFLSLGILTKITPVFLIFYWLIKKEYRIVLSSILSIVVIWIITIPILGLEFHIHYFQWIFSYPFHILEKAQIITNNISIYALLSDITNRFHLAKPIATLIYIIFLISVLFFWYRQIGIRKKLPENESLLEYGWTIALIPLLSHYLEDHHLVNFILLYSTIWIFAKTPLPEWIWGCITLSWIMNIFVYYIQDLSLIPEQLFFLRYINLYSALLVWITVGFMIRFIRFHPVHTND